MVHPFSFPSVRADSGKGDGRLSKRRKGSLRNEAFYIRTTSETETFFCDGQLTAVQTERNFLAGSSASPRRKWANFLDGKLRLWAARVNLAKRLKFE